MSLLPSPAEPRSTRLEVLTLCDHARDFLPCAYVEFLKLAGPTLADEAVEHTNSLIRITWYADRLEIFSPGDPAGLASVRRGCKRNGHPLPEFEIANVAVVGTHGKTKK